MQIRSKKRKADAAQLEDQQKPKRKQTTPSPVSKKDSHANLTSFLTNARVVKEKINKDNDFKQEVAEAIPFEQLDPALNILQIFAYQMKNNPALLQVAALLDPLITIMDPVMVEFAKIDLSFKTPDEEKPPKIDPLSEILAIVSTLSHAATPEEILKAKTQLEEQLKTSLTAAINPANEDTQEQPKQKPSEEDFRASEEIIMENIAHLPQALIPVEAYLTETLEKLSKAPVDTSANPVASTPIDENTKKLLEEVAKLTAPVLSSSALMETPAKPKSPQSKYSPRFLSATASASSSTSVSDNKEPTPPSPKM